MSSDPQELYCEAVQKVRYEDSQGTRELLLALIQGADPNNDNCYNIGRVVQGYGPLETYLLFGGSMLKISKQNGPAQNHYICDKALAAYEQGNQEIKEDATNIAFGNEVTLHQTKNGYKTLVNNQVKALKELSSKIPAHIKILSIFFDSIESLFGATYLQNIKQDAYSVFSPSFMSEFVAILSGNIEGRINAYNYKLDIFHDGINYRYASNIAYEPKCTVKDTKENQWSYYYQVTVSIDDKVYYGYQDKVSEHYIETKELGGVYCEYID